MHFLKYCACKHIQDDSEIASLEWTSMHECRVAFKDSAVWCCFLPFFFLVCLDVW